MYNLENMNNEELCVLYKTTKDDAVFNHLVERNRALILTGMKRYLNRYVDKEELYQASIIEFWKCVKQIDPSKSRLTTYYLNYFALRAYTNYFESSNLIRIPRYVAENEECRDRCIEDTNVLSLEEITANAWGDDDYLDLRLLNAKEIEPDADEENVERLNNIKNGLDILDKREKEMVILRYGLKGDEPLTLRDIGELYDMSRERARQIIKGAINNIKRHIHEQDVTENEGMRNVTYMNGILVRRFVSSNRPRASIRLVRAMYYGINGTKKSLSEIATFFGVEENTILLFLKNDKGVKNLKERRESYEPYRSKTIRTQFE